MDSKDIQQVADHLEIMKLKHKYCHYFDVEKYEEYAELFTEDVVLEDEHWDGEHQAEGREEFLELVTDNPYEYCAHMVFTPIIEIDGDEATGRWYNFITYARDDGSVGWTQGQYNDEYRRVDGEWKISSVTVSCNAHNSFEVTPNSPSWPE